MFVQTFAIPGRNPAFRGISHNDVYYLFSGVHSHAVAFGVDEYPDISDIVVEEGFVEDHLPPVRFDARQDRCHIGGGIEVDESAGMTVFGLRLLANGTGRTGGAGSIDLEEFP